MDFGKLLLSANDVETTEIDIDRKWSLEDLYTFSKNYIQCYSLIYSLSDVQLPRTDYDRFKDYLKGEYSKYPWKGGYSAVNFYRNIFKKIPHEHQPQIISIAYASPGKIKLKEVAIVAATVATIITATTVSIDKINDSYNKIQKGISERKLSKIEISQKELELEDEKMDFVHNSLVKLCKDFKLSKKLIEELHKKTGGNELMQLKIILSLYRRIEPLAIMQANGLLTLEQKEEHEILF